MSAAQQGTRVLGMRLVVLVVAAAVFVAAPASLAMADHRVREYKVTVINKTAGQPFSFGPMVATHSGKGLFFSVGTAASNGIRQIAENGDNRALWEQIRDERVGGRVFDGGQAGPTPLAPAGSPANIGGPLFPHKITFHIRADRTHRRLSWAAMLVCTNDGFTGLDGQRLPRALGARKVIDSFALDAGTEDNTENLADIMPPCQGMVGVTDPEGDPGVATSNPALAENSVIKFHTGIQGTDDLDPAVHGWSHAVARTIIKRVH